MSLLDTPDFLYHKDLNQVGENLYLITYHCYMEGTGLLNFMGQRTGIEVLKLTSNFCCGFFGKK